MLNRYETVFITTPVLSESQMKEAVDKFSRDVLGVCRASPVAQKHNLIAAFQDLSTEMYDRLDFRPVF